jgi:hypothetical protein
MARISVSILSLFGIILAAAEPVPVQRVVLYKNGVGYFEHLGHVRDNQEVSISFTSGQLDDVLKSLTVLDLNGGTVTGVNYGSAAPLDRQLSALQLGTGEKTTLAELLGALRGAKLEIRNGTNVITGRLLSIERKTRMNSGTTLEVDYVALLTDSGEVKTAELSPAFSVRLLDAQLAGRVGKYLDVVSSSREPDERRMVISTAGKGERSLYVSYISEVPVWKTTYRVVLNGKAGKKPLLQGWAIVDNTTGQSWEKVELSLVAGAPQSFIQKLSQPYYARRPVVALPDMAATTPQTFEAPTVMGGARVRGTVTDANGAVIPGAMVTVYDASNTAVSRVTTNANGNYEVAGLAEGQVRLVVEASGFQRAELAGVGATRNSAARNDVRLQVGDVAQSVTVSADSSVLNTSSAMASRSSGVGRNTGSGGALGGNGSGGRLYAPPIPPPPSVLSTESSTSDAREEMAAAAAGRDLGDLFEYKMKEPITILKNQSALVPIAQAPVEVEKVSIWSERTGSMRPRRALWLTNTSGLTLDGGSVSVLEEETFAGEGLVEAMRPNERRLIGYATDLAVAASVRQTVVPQRVTRVRVAHGVMIHMTEQRESKTYTFRNTDTAGRVIVLEHPVRPSFELRSDVKPVETTPVWLRFRVPVAAGQTATLLVDEAKPIETTYRVGMITASEIEVFVRERTIDKALEEALKKIVAQKAVADDLETKADAKDEEKKRIYDDQQRLRENMKALKGSAEERALLQRYTKQLNDQESQLEAISKEIEELNQKKEAAEAVHSHMIEELAFDVRL